MHNAKAVLAAGGSALGVEHIAPADVMTPADRYRELFVAIQSNRIFADSKTFVDSVPRRPPEAILIDYQLHRDEEAFDLTAFTQANFVTEPVPDAHYVSDPDQTISAHIEGLWTTLTRRPIEHRAQSSILPLPHDYVVPGGRFGELYYWDSYFTMLGLAASGRRRLLHTMIDNFSFILDTYGHIPNGNRTYYLSRSQPPVFSLMVALIEREGLRQAAHYLPQLKREYEFWMAGEGDLAPGQAHRHLVRLPDGSLLNRYWDERDTPREEAYLEDVTTAKMSSRPESEVYRDLRAGAASGWDFSSRWLESFDDLSSICTTSILPIDLNCFLYALERQLERLSRVNGDEALSLFYHKRASDRRKAISDHFWNEADGVFVDLNWRTIQQRRLVHAGTVVPLYVGLASHKEAHHIGSALVERLLQPGGLATTDQTSEQQWDKSNGWAPLQWMAIHGLRRYGMYDKAREITHRWITTVAAVYEREAKLVEKYAIGHSPEVAAGGGGGEYPLQDGFGWTNGIMSTLLATHPGHHANKARARRHVRHI